MGNKGMSFSIDDFSMTPNCFLNCTLFGVPLEKSLGKAWEEKYLPNQVTLSACDNVGPNPPQEFFCKNEGDFTTRRSFLVQKQPFQREYQ